MSTIHLTPMQWRILDALVTYRYLTGPQCVQLGISKSADSVREHGLKPLITGPRPLLAGKLFRGDMGGRMPVVVALSQRGAEALAGEWRVPVENIPYPKGGIQFGRDVLHRLSLIDCHIRIRQWADDVGAAIDFADLHFDKIGSQKIAGGQMSASRVNLDRDGKIFVEPDGIFGLSLAGHRVIYALEVHRFPDTKRIAEQLISHGRILMQGSIAQKYGESKANLVLSVHETQRTLERVRQRLLGYKNFHPFRLGFLFNSLDQVRTDITRGWMFADGTPYDPFPRPQIKSAPEVRL